MSVRILESVDTSSYRPVKMLLVAQTRSNARGFP